MTPRQRAPNRAGDPTECAAWREVPADSDYRPVLLGSERGYWDPEQALLNLAPLWPAIGLFLTLQRTRFRYYQSMWLPNASLETVILPKKSR